MKESSQLLFSCTHFSGLNCIVRFVQRSNRVSGGLFICLDGWIWLNGSYGKAWWVARPKTTLFFRLSFSCSSLLVLIYVCETFYNVIAQLHRKCQKVNDIISWMRIIPISRSLRWLFLHLRQYFETTLVNTTTKNGDVSKTFVRHPLGSFMDQTLEFGLYNHLIVEQCVLCVLKPWGVDPQSRARSGEMRRVLRWDCGCNLRHRCGVGP